MYQIYCQNLYLAVNQQGLIVISTNKNKTHTEKVAKNQLFEVRLVAFWFKSIYSVQNNFKISAN